MGSGASLTTIDDLLDLAPSAFATAQNEYLVAVKNNYDQSGNLIGSLDLANIVSRHTAEWGNRVDDLIRGLQQRTRGEVRIGTFGTPEDDPQASLSWQSGVSQVYLRNAGNTGYRSLRLLRMQLNGGALLFDRAGSPEGFETAVGGSICLDYTNRTVWVKTTASGPTGWTNLRSGAPVVDSFGWSGSTTSAYYIPFASKIVESGTMSTQHLYRCPIAGTLDRVVLLCQTDPGSTDFDVMAADGTTSLASQTSVTASGVSWGASSTAYELDFDGLDVTVTAGQYVSMLLDVATSAGEVTGWLEITP